MKPGSSRPFAAALALAIAAATGLPARASAQQVRWGADYFPNVVLTTQDGKEVRFYDDLLKDKVVAIDLVYTHCQFSCPLETARLAQVQRLLGDRVGKEIHFYSITLDPARDTPEVLKAYAERFHAGPGWLFLTGRKEDIQLVARKLGLLSWGSTPVNRDGHTPTLMLGDVPRGLWMKNSAVDDPRFLANVMRTFLASSAAETARPSYEQARPLAPSKGQYLFRTRCSACHTVGRGDSVGPDLAGVTRARDRAWLARFIQFPDRVLAEGDPLAKELHQRFNQVNMPNLGLGPEDVEALLEHLDRESAALASHASAR